MEKEESKIVKGNEWNEQTHHDFMKDTRLFREIVMPLREAGVKGDDKQYYRELPMLFRTDKA